MTDNVNLSAGISLLSGVMFDYKHPDKCDLVIEDIATALSNVCRFSGHLPRFYSVAQHLVNTSKIVPKKFAFTALMHDTAEAFTNDLPTPLKHALPVFKKLETSIEEAMSRKFDFIFPYPEEVKKADKQMLLLEKVYIKGDDRVWDEYVHIRFKHLKDKVDLTSWRPSVAKARFISRYKELTNEEGRQPQLCAA